MENTLTYKDVKVGDILQIINSIWDSIPKYSIGSVIDISNSEFVRIKWINISHTTSGLIYIYRFRKLTKEEAMLEML